LLELQDGNATSNANGGTRTTTSRIGATSGQGNQQQTARSGSSLTSRSRNTTRTPKTLTEDDLYRMPLDQLKTLANQQAN
jgi:hypothetical protein